MSKAYSASLALIAAMLIGVPLALAGDLDPPSGAVDPTMKTLEEVEPRTPIANDFVTLTPIEISGSGSYYLTEDITGLPNETGILISASNVTLDLNGFTIRGNFEVGSGYGVFISNGLTDVTVRNGTIRDFDDGGVVGFNTDSCVFTDLRLINNSAGLTTGALQVGDNARVERCLARDNHNDGFRAGDRAIFLHCTAENNATDGFDIGDTARLTGCTATDSGTKGFTVGADCIIDRCIAKSSTERGIEAGEGANITGCVSENNGFNGINADDNSAVSSCVSRNNGGAGIDIALWGRVESSTANDNGSTGINAANGLIRGCVATNNSGSQIVGALKVDNWMFP